MNNIPPSPPTPPAPIPQPAPTFDELTEGVPPKVRFQKSKKTESLKEIQESPIFNP